METKRMKMIYDLSPQAFDSIHKYEAIREDQVTELAVVMLDSLKNTCEDKGETLLDIINELVEVIDGSFAPFISDASYQIRQNGEIAASIMISYYEGYPLISEIFTNKKYQGLGMAKALIKKSINSLLKMGYKKLVLNVEVENIAALNLYKKIGFQKEEINQIK